MADRRVAREQVLGFRAHMHGLAVRRPASELLAVAGACGVQDTPPGTADVSLAARLDIHAPVADEAVAAKQLALTWSVRGAPHLVPPEDLPVFTIGARPDAGTLASLWRQPEHALVEVEKAMVAALRRGPKTKGEVSGAVTAATPDLAPFCRACNVHHPNESVFRAAPLLGRIVLTSTSPVTLTTTKSWLGRDTKGDVDAMRTELLLRYVHCYAPTTAEHFAAWAGIASADARARWSAIADALVPVHAGRKAFVLEDDLDALERSSPGDEVRLLPNKDAFLQARDRELLFTDAAHRKAVFPMLGGPGVVLAGSTPVATWRGAAKGKGYEVTVSAFGRLSKTVAGAIEDEAERVAHVRGKGHLTRVVTT